jgi:hypothetical protein
MKKILTGLSLTIGVFGLTHSAQALDAWVVTQTVKLPGSSGTELTQGALAKDSSMQALNAVNVGTLNGTSQTVDLSAAKLTLTQKESAEGSTQAANFIRADETIGTFTQTLTGSATSGDAIELAQKATGTANIQALNSVEATSATSGNIDGLAQEVTEFGADILLNQIVSGIGKNAVQAVNRAKSGGSITSLTQEVATSADINLNQAGNQELTQAGNYAEAVTIASLTQDLAGAKLNLTQTEGSTNKQWGNYAAGTVSASGTVSQEATAVLTLKQDATTGGANNEQAVNAVNTAGSEGTITQTAATPGGSNNTTGLTQTRQTNSRQFVNYLTSDGTVASVVQEYKETVDTVTMGQNDSTDSYQEVNAVEMTGGVDVLTSATQTLTAKEMEMKQGTLRSNTGSYQAGNLIVVENEINKATQEVSSKEIAMKQEGGVNNFQALNLTEAGTVTGTDGLLQTVTSSTATADSWEQSGSGTGNTQAGNYFATNGAVSKVEQEYEATGKITTLVQKSTTSGVQGLNVINAKQDAEFTSAQQTASLANLTMRQGAAGEIAQSSVQAGNAVITVAAAVGGAVVQGLTVTGALDMTQQYATNSYQAANYVGYMPQ